jgi:hypothetical protein
MALCGTDRSLHDGKVGDPWGLDILRLGDQHGHVDMIGKQARGFDGTLVAPVDERHAFARQAD